MTQELVVGFDEWLGVAGADGMRGVLGVWPPYVSGQAPHFPHGRRRTGAVAGGAPDRRAAPDGPMALGTSVRAASPSLAGLRNRDVPVLARPAQLVLAEL